MGLLGGARANTSVGVVPETFLLLLLQRVQPLGCTERKVLMTTVHPCEWAIKG
jgi:hypothetical protein